MARGDDAGLSVVSDAGGASGTFLRFFAEATTILVAIVSENPAAIKSLMRFASSASTLGVTISLLLPSSLLVMTG
jgi:hypothetical protein